MRKTTNKKALKRESMNKKSFPKKVLVIPVALFCLLLGAAALAGIRSYRHKKYEEQVRLQMEAQLAEQREAAFGSLAWADYQCVFLSMYDIPSFLGEDFQHFTGKTTVKQDYVFSTTEDVNDALNTVFRSGNTVTNVYFGLDPFLLYHSMGDDSQKIEKAMETCLLTHVDSHQETIFEILFSFPSIDYWLSLSEDDFSVCLSLYHTLVNLLITRENIIVHFPSGQAWLIDNPSNYAAEFIPEAPIAQKLTALICARLLQVNQENSSEMLLAFSNLLTSRRESPVEYPDLSQWDIVFFGDSIFGNYDGSLSIPGAVNGLSNATVYNCAQGGACAAKGYSDYGSFPDMAESFVSDATANLPDNHFGQGVKTYQSKKHGVKKLCIIINYGLNDYFNGLPLDNPEDAYDTTTYAGSLRTGIATLRERYPNALYVIANPGRVTIFENGTMLMGESQEPLSTYSNCSKSLSTEMGTLLIDLYDDLTDDTLTPSDVLEDTVHYNEYGRYLFARKIIDLLAEQPPQKQIAR